jgi:hypothetical protein
VEPTLCLVRRLTARPRPQCEEKLAADPNDEFDVAAGLDEGLLSLSLPIIVCMENPYLDKN